MKTKRTTRSTPKRSKTRETGEIKLLFILILTGAVLGSMAPFVHIFYPKTAPEVIALNKAYDGGKIPKAAYLVKKEALKKKYSYFGFTNKRRFLFAIGLPTALFVCSFTLLYVSRFINDKSVKKGSVIAGATFQFTAIYFIVWTLWAYTYKEKDFSRPMYYTAIALSSALIAMTVVQFQKSISNHHLKIKELIHFIVLSRKKIFNVLDHKKNHKNILKEKEQFDKEMYDTFEKVLDK